MDCRKSFYEFGRALYKIDGFYAEYAKTSGVKENLLWVLYALNDGNKHSQKEICESWDLPRTTVNTIVKELEEEGYVVLSQIKGEKRELELALTEKGKAYAESLLSELYEIESKAFGLLKELDLANKMSLLLNELQNKKKEVEAK